MAHLRRLLTYAVCVAIATPPFAYGQTAPASGTNATAPVVGLDGVSLAGSQGETYGRLVINWPEGTQYNATASLNGSIVLIRLPKAVDLDPAVFSTSAPQFVAAAALSADKRTIRVAMVQNVRLVQSRKGSTQAFDVVQPDAPDPPVLGAPIEVARIEPEAATQSSGPPGKMVNGEAPRGAPRVQVDAATSADFTRLRLSNTGGSGLPAHGYARYGDRLAIAIPGLYALDIASIRAKPPARVRDAARYSSQSNTSLVLDVEPSAVVRHSRDGDAIVIDILPPGTDPNSLQALQTMAAANVGSNTPTVQRTQSPTPPASGQPQPSEQALTTELAAESVAAARPDPAPSGVVKVVSSKQGADAVLEFGFETPAPAAIFRRGDSIYALFATAANFDVSSIKAQKVGFPVTPIKGEGVSGVRIVAAPDMVANPSALGKLWRVGFSSRKDTGARPISIERETAADGTARLKASVPDSAATGKLVDPVVGDTILLGLALGPASALQSARAFLEANLPETFHGLAVTPRADDLDLRRDGDGFVLVRPSGLALSSSADASQASGFASNAPGFVDFVAWKLGPKADFLRNVTRLRKEAAFEVGDATAGVRKRLDLARFYLAWELGAEAAGVLRQIRDENVAMARAPELIGLEGAAQVQTGHSKQALETLSQPEVAADPASQLWASLAAQLDENSSEALLRFERGKSALNSFAPAARAQFLIANAQAALNTGDATQAIALARRANEEAQDETTKEHAQLTGARALAKLGKSDEALPVLANLISSKDPEIAAKAIFEKTVIGIDTGKMSLPDAVRALDALRYGWRGDTFELEVLRRLGGLYITGGDLRSGLTTMTAATTLRPDLPAARALRDELYKQFKYLFLDGGADGMPPVQALALFYDFKDLAPIGPEGDRMVRGLADRLVALDLLPQATQLLQHQVDNRLEGFAKAQVATDLAAIYLMDRRAEPALQTIWNSRVTQLPAALNAQRRLIEAAALAELGRDDHALEIIEFDNSSDASRLRAELYMRKGDWAKAAENARVTLPAVKANFEPEEAGEVLRTAVATSVAGDRAGLSNLVSRFGAPMGKSAYSEAFKIVTDPGIPDPVVLQKAVADLTGGSPYNGLMKRLRTRLTGMDILAAPTPAPTAQVASVDVAPPPASKAPLVPAVRPNVAPSVAPESAAQNSDSAPKNAVQAPRDPPPAPVTAR